VSRKVPVAMTIAGSDSGGGAGIQADLKTFAALGVHGTVALTSVTAQNTYKVSAIHDLPPDMVEAQIRAVHEDMGVDAAKTGMLSNKDIVERVARVVSELSIPLVVDPVMVAKSGARLLREDAAESLKKTLLKEAVLVTPNLPEAEALTGLPIASVRDMREAAQIIAEKFGPQAVVVKGGHLRGNAVVDVLYANGKFFEFSRPRVPTENDHGSGCTFSAAITANLAKGHTLVESVSLAVQFMTSALLYSLPLGRGHGPVNPVAPLEEAAERWRVLKDVESAVNALLANQEYVAEVVPEVGMNIGMSLPWLYARSPLDVAAVPGRISRMGKRLVVPGKPEFGASSHVANLILEVMKFEPALRAAANLAYTPGVEEKLRGLGFSLSWFDRREEPEEIKRTEGMTTAWGVRFAVSRAGMRVPDAIIDYGEHGKEPLVFIIGKAASEVALRIVNLARSLSRD